MALLIIASLALSFIACWLGVQLQEPFERPTLIIVYVVLSQALWNELNYQQLDNRLDALQQLVTELREDL